MVQRGFLTDMSLAYAVRIVKLHGYLHTAKNETEMSSALLRCGAGIGALLHAAVYSPTEEDFALKYELAAQQAAEADFWLKLLHETGYLSATEFQSIHADTEQLQKLLLSGSVIAGNGNA